jgi:type II secretory pathway component PulJ
MTRLRGRDGFTLVELLVAMSMSMIVALATFALVEVTMRRATQVGTRVEAVQRGRSVMDLMTRELRSQVCVWRNDDLAMTAPRTLYAATPTMVTFFADLSDESLRTGVTKVLPPQQRSLSFENNSIVERDYALTLDPLTGKYALTATPTSTRTLMQDVAPATGTGIFSYAIYNTAVTPAVLTPLTLAAGASLSAVQLPLVSRISLSFRALASRAKPADKTSSTVFSDDVFNRTANPDATDPTAANPNAQTPNPTCA